MKTVADIFIELLQVSIGNRLSLSVVPSAEEWEEIYDIAKKQTLVGICFHGLKLLPEDQLPPPQRLRQWAVKAMRLQEKNSRITQECKIVTEVFANAHYESCVLKGQGNALLYPETLRQLRSPGDIDLWVWENTPQKGLDKKRLVRAVWKLSKHRMDVAVHHAECEIFRKTPVEVHFEPSFSLNPLTDCRMQRYWQSHKGCIVKAADGFNVPSVELNLVFQMSHIYRHLLLEGIGFRQLLDYFFLLKTAGDIDRTTVFRDLCSLGMSHITAAVMWVMADVFRLEEKYLLCPPSQRYGKEMLKEVLEGGNFGHSYATKVERELDDNGKETTASKLEGNIETIRRGMRFMRSYPSECLWVPWLCVRASLVRNYWRKVKT